MSAHRALSPDQFGEAEESPHWEFDVLHSTHDEMKQGKVDVRRSRVLISKEHYPNHVDAAATAYLMGHARGEYPTSVLHRY